MKRGEYETNKRGTRKEENQKNSVVQKPRKRGSQRRGLHAKCCREDVSIRAEKRPSGVACLYPVLSCGQRAI